MSASTVLHIQGRREGPPRVVELNDRPMRVGRGRHCEIRLDEPRLPNEVCRLRPTKEGWRVEPGASPALLSIYGEPIGRSRLLDVNVPLRVGEYWLVIRSEAPMLGTFEEPIVVEPDVDEPFDALAAAHPVHKPVVLTAVSESEPRLELAPEPAPEPIATEAARLKEWEERLAARERKLNEREEGRARLAKWRELGERLRPTTPVPDPTRQVRPTPPRMVAPVADKPAPAHSRAEVRPPRLLPSSAARERMEEVLRPILRPDETPPAPRVEIPRPNVEAPTTIRVELIAPPVEVEDSPSAQLDPLPAWNRRLERDFLADSEDDSEPNTAPEPTPHVEADPSRFDAFVAQTAAPTLGVHRSETAVPEWEGHRNPPRSENVERPRSVAGAARPRVAGAPLVSERPFGVDPGFLKTRAEAEENGRRHPTARAIIDAQRRRDVPEPNRPRRSSQGPRPTEGRAPESWNAPFWLAALPALVLILAFGGGGTALAALWAIDAQTSNVAFAAALRLEGEPAPPLDPEVRPNAAWYRATPKALAAWALALERSGEGAPAIEESARLLEAARHLAPLDPTVRHALAQNPGAAPGAALGLAREPFGLALAAKRLKAAGKKPDAVRLYRTSLELAALAPIDPKSKPSFDDDPRMRRYRLPDEAVARSILTELVDDPDWPYAEWSEALPKRAVVRLAAARLLWEKSRPEAEAAFDAVIAVDEVPETGTASHWAARGEALAFGNRSEDASECYEKARELSGSLRISRLLAYNQAEILRSLSRDKERAGLLQAAVGEDLGEEISRRAIEAQALLGTIAEPTLDPAVQPATAQVHADATDPRRGTP